MGEEEVLVRCSTRVPEQAHWNIPSYVEPRTTNRPTEDKQQRQGVARATKVNRGNTEKETAPPGKRMQWGNRDPQKRVGRTGKGMVKNVLKQSEK